MTTLVSGTTLHPYGAHISHDTWPSPQVSLVVILDADKEGFLRSERSLIQTIGRASRHVNGTVSMNPCVCVVCLFVYVCAYVHVHVLVHVCVCLYVILQAIFRDAFFLQFDLLLYAYLCACYHTCIHVDSRMHDSQTHALTRAGHSVLRASDCFHVSRHSRDPTEEGLAAQVCFAPRFP